MERPSYPLMRNGRHRHRTPGGFQTVWLNFFGWGALVGTGLAVGAIAGLVTPLPLWITLVAGVLVTWAVVLVLDRHRFRNSTIHVCRDDLDHETGAAVVAHLEGLGIAATYEEDMFDDEDEPYVQRGILCRQADVDAVERVMSEHLA